MGLDYVFMQSVFSTEDDISLFLYFPDFRHETSDVVRKSLPAQEKERRRREEDETYRKKRLVCHFVKKSILYWISNSETHSGSVNTFFQEHAQFITKSNSGGIIYGWIVNSFSTNKITIKDNAELQWTAARIKYKEASQKMLKIFFWLFPFCCEKPLKS